MVCRVPPKKGPCTVDALDPLDPSELDQKWSGVPASFQDGEAEMLQVEYARVNSQPLISIVSYYLIVFDIISYC